jgi:hypothetical protein
MRKGIWKAIAGAALLLSFQQLVMAQNNSPKIHLIWMGGNDCPPCVQWRASELPKLQASAVFNKIKFSYVVKTVQSGVPPSIFLDEDVKPYKDKLDQANSGRGGSPQGALIVDGEIFDYFLGVRTADEIESMINAVSAGTRYPFRRCLKVVGSRAVRRCEIAA